MNDVELLQSLRAEAQEQKELPQEIRKIDFKMVTFTLAGKDYGIDIMKVKEIRKAGNFTYVPNTPPFVRGVDNLRGDIISVIDLRIMFNLPAAQKANDALENILILRLDESIIGVIVDSIDKVVGISSELVQPPHPLFGDINIKYISGVVENNSRLYIILDSETIFSEKEDEQDVAEEQAQILSSSSSLQTPTVAREEHKIEDVGLKFIKETLSTFVKFYSTAVNETWLHRRFQTWSHLRKQRNQDVQLTDVSEAEEFLADFYSPHSGQLWNDSYGRALTSVLEASSSKIYKTWNIGCGKGAEAYSLAIYLKDKFPDKKIKVWANDNDLLNISSAPTLLLPEGELPSAYDGAVIDTKSGRQFSKEIKDIITFEYHDVVNVNPFEDLDLIVARDVVSFLKVNDQKRVLHSFKEKLKPGGFLVLGHNEIPFNLQEWETVQADNLIVYRKIVE